MLKPGGKLIVTVPSVNIPLVTKHYQHFTRESLSRALCDHFEVLEVLGQSKIRNVSLLTRLFYWRLKGVSRWFYPFRNYSLVARLFKSLNDFYNSELATGEAEDCDGLISVCRKF